MDTAGRWCVRRLMSAVDVTGAEQAAATDNGSRP
jgi:hypothetical protein